LKVEIKCNYVTRDVRGPAVETSDKKLRHSSR